MLFYLMLSQIRSGGKAFSDQVQTGDPIDGWFLKAWCKFVARLLLLQKTDDDVRSVSGSLHANLAHTHYEEIRKRRGDGKRDFLQRDTGA